MYTCALMQTYRQARAFMNVLTYMCIQENMGSTDCISSMCLGWEQPEPGRVYVCVAKGGCVWRLASHSGSH